MLIKPLLLLLLFALTLPQTNARRRPPSKSNLPAQFLRPHNAIRASIGLPPLSWDPRLARYAQQYARKRQRDCALAHSNGPYGETSFGGADLAGAPPKPWPNGPRSGDGTVIGLILVLEEMNAGIILRSYGAGLRGLDVRWLIVKGEKGSLLFVTMILQAIMWERNHTDEKIFLLNELSRD
ncbi:uncharacterized protein A4U43_C05F25190 [Asparagus officinalis]|uniref:SCP domain-containing protein n=1 Tax=Asparagus officinalis TaxID=4686 RepID=A0A5P1EZQ2_ASPOF|nr:uncharacterized protein A4U43_C05F25190 [Asparagus officinalis]